MRKTGRVIAKIDGVIDDNTVNELWRDKDEFRNENVEFKLDTIEFIYK